jgi:DNA-binding response OmpR family regulator
MREDRWVGTLARTRSEDVKGEHVKGRILVVDDDEGLQRAIKRAAETAGFEVSQVFDGLDALTLLVDETFDLILLDINMPAMDGRDVLSHLKRDPKTAEIPVLIHSSRGGQLDRQHVLKLGAEDFLEKPMDLKLLMAKIDHFVERAQNRTKA